MKFKERIFVKCPGCLKTGWIANIKRENLPKPCPNGTIMKTCNECLIEEEPIHNVAPESYKQRMICLKHWT